MPELVDGGICGKISMKTRIDASKQHWDRYILQLKCYEWAHEITANGCNTCKIYNENKPLKEKSYGA